MIFSIDGINGREVATYWTAIWIADFLDKGFGCGILVLERTQ